MRLLRRLYVTERICLVCESHRPEKSQPREVGQFVHGSVVAMVYQTKRYGRKRFFIELGLWHGMAKGMVLGRYFDSDDMSDALSALADAQHFIANASNKHR